MNQMTLKININSTQEASVKLKLSKPEPQRGIAQYPPVRYLVRSVPPKSGNADGKCVRSLHTPELNSGLHGLMISSGRCTVIPVQHDNAVPVPVTRRNSARLVGAHHKSPIERTTNTDANSLAPRTSNVTRENGFRGLSHGVKLLIHTPAPVAVDLDYTATSTATTAFRSREQWLTTSIKCEIPHQSG